MAPLFEIFLPGLTRMTARVITDDVNRLVAQQVPAYVIEIAEEQGGRAPFFGEALGQHQRTGAPVQGASEIALIFVPGVTTRLLAPPHPRGVALGIGIHIVLILKHRNLVLRQTGQELAPRPQLLASLGI